MNDTFTELERLTTKEFLEKGNYAAGYVVVAREMQVGSPEKKWFDNAAEINAGVGPASVGCVLARTTPNPSHSAQIGA